MRRFALATICFLAICSNVLAQDGYFISIQSDNNQAFYTRIGEKTWGASKVGHLVIPGLKDSTYRMYIGFPGGQNPEQLFIILFNRKDLGFHLKKTGEQGWGLVNTQTQEVVSPSTDLYPVESMYFGEKKKDEAFTRLMAAVVNDTAVLYTTMVRAVPPKQEAIVQVKTETKPVETSVSNQVIDTSGTARANIAIDSAVTSVGLVADSAVKTVVATDSIISSRDSGLAVKTGAKSENPSPIAKPGVLLLEEKVSGGGRKLIYIDNEAGNMDTIDIEIAFEKDLQPEPLNKVDSVVVTLQPVNIDSTSKIDSPKVKSMESVASKPDTASSSGTTSIDPDKSDKKKLVMLNSDCNNFATDYDVDKLRLKIMAETNIDGRLAAARKIFKTKCFTTKQFRALSELFMNDEERFKFFELGYPYATDTGNYRQLVDLLSETTYVNRFKTMVRLPLD